MSSPTGAAAGGSATTYYEVLEVSENAEQLDIKKAYRRLALRHHPDRNNGSAESTERFKAIGEAYQVLSNPSLRADYDRSLRESSPPSSPQSSSYNSPTTTAAPTRTNHVGRRPHRPYYRAPHSYVDPFTQFNTLFQNDPFFQESFRGMEDEFAKRFAPPATTSTSPRGTTTVAPVRNTTPAAPAKEGLIMWLLRQCGVQVHVSTYSNTSDGGYKATSYTNNPRAQTYTNKQSRTFVDGHGRRVTIQSMERDGNQIQNKYINDVLVERRVNGVVEALNNNGRIGHS